MNRLRVCRSRLWTARLRRSIARVLALQRCSVAALRRIRCRPATDTVIGEVQHVVAQHEDTLLDIGRRYGVGYEEIVAANPGVDPWLPGEGTRGPHSVALHPSGRAARRRRRQPRRASPLLLPARQGRRGAGRQTYPISIGKMDWKTPLGMTRIVQQAREADLVSARIGASRARSRRPSAAEGRAGRARQSARRLRDAPRHSRRRLPDSRHESSGRRRHAGDARLHPHVSGGHRASSSSSCRSTRRCGMIDQPYKMGWRGEELYIEVHAPLEGQETPGDAQPHEHHAAAGRGHAGPHGRDRLGEGGAGVHPGDRCARVGPAATGDSAGSSDSRRRSDRVQRVAALLDCARGSCGRGHLSTELVHG